MANKTDATPSPDRHHTPGIVDKMTVARYVKLAAACAFAAGPLCAAERPGTPDEATLARPLSATAIRLAQSSKLEARTAFDIPAQPLGASLKQVADQAGIQILFEERIVSGINAPEIRANQSALQTLQALLEGTDLEFTAKSETVAIRERGRASATSRHTAEIDNSARLTSISSGPIRLAQNGQSAQAGQEVPPDNGSRNSKEQVEEVVVTGSRIRTVVGEQVLPARAYTREDIERSGQVRITDYFNTLPSASLMTSEMTQANGNIESAAQLHGLPIGTTLTLLNGHRTETDPNGVFDINNLPVSAIERIEVLPVGASAVYGSDALAGAVNFILRKDFDGLEFNASYTRMHGANTVDLSGAWGRSWDRGSMALFLSHSRVGALDFADTEVGTFREYPAGATNFLVYDGCAPGTVYSLDPSQNLPGLSSPYAAIPNGITGTPAVADFTAGAGNRNLCNLLPGFDLVAKQTRTAALLTGRFQVNDSAELYLEFLGTHGDTPDNIGYQLWSFGDYPDGLPYLSVLAADNPYNPFGVDVAVGFENRNYRSEYQETNKFYRPLVGIKGRLSGSWEYDASAYYSSWSLDYYYNSLDPAKVAAALASSDPATAINPFTTGAAGTPEAIQALLQDQGRGDDTTFSSKTSGAQAYLTGTLLQLPSGPLKSVIGAEYVRVRQGVVAPDLGIPEPVNLSRNNYAVFGEARVPLLGAAEGSLGRGDRLALSLAARYDHSNDFGGKATWQSGLRWKMTDSVALTGSYGLSYRAPRLNEVQGAQVVSPVTGSTTPDPLRGNAPLGDLTLVFGPNPDIKPESGNSRTVGIEFAPPLDSGLRVALTWYEISLTNYIAAQSLDTVLAYPDSFPGAVQRDPPTAQDIANGYPGRVTRVDLSNSNFGDIDVGGVDLDASLNVDTRIGRLTPSLAISNIYEWRSALVPGLPSVNRVSAPDDFALGWAPRWKATAALNWSRNALSGGVTGRWVGRYKDVQNYTVNTNHLGNDWIVDLHARYDAGKALAPDNHWLAGSYVGLSVVDLLNRTPPFSYNVWGIDYYQYDPRGRLIRLQIGSKW